MEATLPPIPTTVQMSSPPETTKSEEEGSTTTASSGPSIMKQLRERALNQLELKHQEYERQQQELAELELKRKEKKRTKLFRNHFKLKKDSTEAQDKIKKLSRKDKKHIKQEYERLSQLSQRELQSHMMLKDPNNPFMRKLTLEGEQGIEDLQRTDIWNSIMKKKQMHHENINDFLNSLTENEFTEFIQARDIPLEKLNETGRASELAGFGRLSVKETEIDMREQHL